MLAPRTLEIIQSTVPVLKVHGEAITTRFYQRLFESHPGLRDVFNQARQREGKQQAALANAVYAAAQNIARLEAILPAVVSIAHKHRGLGVQAEHYPLVGEHLLAAIREVLGEAATPEILGAWAEAYQEIASVFIAVERDLYAKAHAQAGGWSGFRRFVVAHTWRTEDPHATLFELRPEDGQPVASFMPGQYLTVKVGPPGDARTHLRHVPLVPVGEEGVYRLQLKRAAEQADEALDFLHQHVRAGDVLLASAPAGVTSSR